MKKSLWLLAAVLVLAACQDEGRLEPVRWIEPVPPVEFPLQISADQRHLVDQAGNPFFLHGDSAWSLISGATRLEAQTYFADRVNRGFNSILVVLIDHTDPLVNAEGDAPFTVDGDFSTPNPAYFNQADWMIEQAASNGMLVWLSPIYLGYNGGDEGFYADALAAGPTAMREWGRWVGERYAHVDGLVWLMGGDYVPPPEGLALLAEVVAGIRDFDTRHLFAAHWARESSGWEVDVPWLDLNTTYTSPPVYPQVLEDRAGMMAPLVMLEAFYENEYSVTLPQVRAQGYQAILGGATGHFFGNYPVWKFASGWKNELGSDGAVSMTHLRNLFVGMAWSSLEPDTSDALITSGRGPGGSEDFVTLARDPDGHLAVAHVPTPRALEFDLQSMAGPVNVRWFDPTNGRFTVVDSAAPPEVPLTLAPVGDNSADDPDWILVLESE